MPIIFQSQGNDRLMFLCEIDLSSEVPSSWMAALDMLQKNYANELVVSTCAEVMRKDIVIVTVHGVSINLLNACLILFILCLTSGISNLG